MNLTASVPFFRRKLELTSPLLSIKHKMSLAVVIGLIFLSELIARSLRHCKTRKVLIELK